MILSGGVGLPVAWKASARERVNLVEVNMTFHRDYRSEAPGVTNGDLLRVGKSIAGCPQAFLELLESQILPGS